MRANVTAATYNPIAAPKKIAYPTMIGVTESLYFEAYHPPIGKEMMNAP